MNRKYYGRRESKYNPKESLPDVSDLLEMKPNTCRRCGSMACYVDVEGGSEVLQQRIFFYCLICGDRSFPFPAIQARGHHESRRNDL